MKEKEAKIQARELLKLSECIDNIDDDVIDSILGLQLITKNKFSMSDIARLCQDIKDKAIKKAREENSKLLESYRQEIRELQKHETKRIIKVREDEKEKAKQLVIIERREIAEELDRILDIMNDIERNDRLDIFYQKLKEGK